MKLSTRLKDVRGAASLCIKCAGCTYAEWPETYPLCPIYSRDNCFTFCGGGLLYLVKALVDQKIEFSQSIADLAFACTGCGACDARCGIIRSHTPYADPWDIVRLLRHESVKRGFIPEGIPQQIHHQVRTDGDFGRENGFKIPGKIANDKADTVIFAECFHTDTQSHISKSVLSLLEKIGRPVSDFSEKGCCGSTLYDLGFWEQLEPLIKTNWKKMKDVIDKKIVFMNPHCQEFIVKRYPENLPDYKSIRHQHFSQLLTEAFKGNKLRSKKSDKVKVSYHDPCYLGRGLRIYDAPREVLSFLHGVDLVEMERNRENSFCCGARAMSNYFSDMSEVTARERLDEFRATGAERLITACPYCKEIFQKVLGKEKEIVTDLIEFVDDRT
jgi:Fe-S oxidoreductase